MNTWWMAYGAAWIVIGLLDALWLGVVARDLYQREMGSLMATEIRKLPAALFYFGYPAGLLALALPGGAAEPGPLSQAMWRGALVGLVAYGTYDLTNLAVLRGFSVKLALVDMAWGVFISAAGAAAAAWVMMKRS